MDQVINYFKKLFDTSDFPARWNCGKWDDFTGWFFIVSDLLIWSAYFAIPLIIIRYITRKQNARFNRIYLLFASFILACGTTHLLDAVMFWHPAYRFNGLIRFFTGLISWVTAFNLMSLLPEAFTLKSARELEDEVQQRKAAEERLSLQNKMLNEAQEIARIGYWQWDVEQRKLTWSDSLFKIYGRPPAGDDLTYDYYLSCIHPEDRDFVAANIQAAVERRQFEEFYHRIILPDGSIRTLHAKGDLILNGDGEVIRMIGTGQDVTEQKKVEQELLAKTKELEASNIELQKFASVASHDLREPLRKIMTFATMLDKESKNLSEKGVVYVEKIVSAAGRMQQLIEDILDFSRLSNKDISFEKVNLNQVIDQVLLDMEVNITVANAKIHVGRLPVIDGNASQLGQLFQNLISNSIKFAKENVHPVISIHSETVSGSQLPMEYLKGSQYSVLGNPRFWENERFCRIYVRDNGIGFDETYVDRIFTIFQRLHGRSDYEGTGIGLAICKKVVDIHHGSITAESKSGEGSTFVILLPYSQRNFLSTEV